MEQQKKIDVFIDVCKKHINKQATFDELHYRQINIMKTFILKNTRWNRNWTSYHRNWTSYRRNWSQSYESSSELLELRKNLPTCEAVGF